MIRFLLVGFIATSCSMSQGHRKSSKEEIRPKEIKPPRRSRCPDRINVKDGVEPWNSYDQGLVKGMNDGCRRHYSSAHCAVEILKTSVQEYSIKCGLVERSDDD